MDEDKRQAAGLKVGISNYVATAALAVLAGALGLFTYVAQGFSPPWTFYALMASVALMLVLSIAIGGLGADRTVASIAEGTWSPETRTREFSRQASLTLLALILLVVATAVGTASPKATSAVDQRLERIEQRLGRLSDAVGKLERAEALVDQRLRRVERAR